MHDGRLDCLPRWSFEAVEERYARYCREFFIQNRPLARGYAWGRGWNVSAAMSCLLPRIRQGDLAAAEIGLELIEEDFGCAFGSIEKSNVGRALGRCQLTERQKIRVRHRVVEMLLRPFLPKEFRQYAWLCRRLGLGPAAEALASADRSNPWVDWYVRYLTLPYAGPRPSPSDFRFRLEL